MNKQVLCKFCNQNVEQRDFQVHQQKFCDNKPKFCRFCETSIMKNDFQEHVVQCSARTQQCFNCGKNIILRYDHEAICIYDIKQNMKDSNIVKIPTNQQKKANTPIVDEQNYDYDYDDNDDYYNSNDVYDSEAVYSEEVDSDDDQDENNKESNIQNQNKKKKENGLLNSTNINKNKQGKNNNDGYEKKKSNIVNLEDDINEQYDSSEEYQDIIDNKNQKDFIKFVSSEKNIFNSQDDLNASEKQPKKVLLRQNSENQNGIKDIQEFKTKMFTKLDSLIEKHNSMSTRGDKKTLQGSNKVELNKKIKNDNRREEEFKQKSNSEQNIKEYLKELEDKVFQDEFDQCSINSISDDKHQVKQQGKTNKEKHKNPESSQTQPFGYGNAKQNNVSSQYQNHTQQTNINSQSRRQQEQMYLNEDEELQKAIQQSLLFQ